ncbi:hypothetical protein [Latilactobacillus sakei]|uniref:hypothetical protein n=1 Tax=Latilactobacillus sakei TaxID=1599 RepID=UPI003F5100AD
MNWAFSKQAIWQKIKRDASIDLRQFTSTKGNTVYVDVDGQKLLRAMFKTIRQQDTVNKKMMLTTTKKMRFMDR